MATSDAQVRRPRTGFGWLLAAPVLGCLVVVASYHRELRPPTRLTAAGSRDAGWLDAHVSVLAVTPEHEELRLRISITPHGRLDRGAGVLSRVVRLHADAVGWDEVELAAGRRIFPRDLTLDLTDGEPVDYPFDRYRAELDLLAEVDVEGGTVAVPVDITFDDSHHGFRFTTSSLAVDDDGYGGFDVELRRSGVVLGLAIFLMMLAWGVSYVSLRLLSLVLEGTIEVNLDMFVAFTGLLVGMYFFRSVLPEVPPISGTLADFLAFLWAEITAALGTVAVGVIWTRRAEKP
ncbi:MAG: DUF4436 family protein [bacterium]